MSIIAEHVNLPASLHIALKIEEARTNAKKIYGEDWPKEYEFWSQIIKNCMAKDGFTNILEAVLHLCNKTDNNAGVIMSILGTAADMLKPEVDQKNAIIDSSNKQFKNNIKT